MKYFEGQIKNDVQLIIRTPTEADAAAMLDYLNIVGGESDNLLFGPNGFHLTIDEEKEVIRNINKNPNQLMLIGVVKDQVVSIAQLNSAKRKRVAHNSELAISVKKEYWRMGIASLMMEGILQFAEQHETIKNISLGVKAENLGAIQLYEKFGFKQIGKHKDYYHINGVYYDLILMDKSIKN